MIALLQCVDISDDDAMKKMPLVNWTVCSLLEQQHKEFCSNREN